MQRQISAAIDSGRLLIGDPRDHSHSPLGASAGHAHFTEAAVREATRGLDRRWRTLLAAIDDRTTVLRLAAGLHRRAEQYSCEVPEWTTLCDGLHVPDHIVDLEAAIGTHQHMLRDITDSYSKV